MAHNPPRVWITEEQMRDVSAAARRELQEWNSVEQLADKMLERAKSGRNVVLGPGTAEFLARWVKWKAGDPG